MYINALVLYMMSVQSFVTVRVKVVTFGFLPQEFFRMEDFVASPEHDKPDEEATCLQMNVGSHFNYFHCIAY